MSEVNNRTSLHRKILSIFADNIELINYLKWFCAIRTHFVFYKSWSSITP